MKQNSQLTPTHHAQPMPIAIIGIGCIFPKAHNLSEYWTNLKEGVDAITDIPPDTHWDPAEYFHNDPKAPDRVYAKKGGFVPTIDFNPLDFGILPNAIEATDTTQLLSLVAAQDALNDAGYGADREFDRDRVSVILGITGTLELVIPLGARLGHPIWRRALKEAGIEGSVAQDVIERISNSYVEWQENSFPGLLGNVAAGRIANRFDFGGTNCAVDAACASSLSAIHLAMLELTSGQADMVVTGGADTFNHVFMYACFSKTPALSPSGHARPFDQDCDGTTLGEGVGIIVLKRLTDAERDGDKIYAVIKGIGASSDGKGNAIYAPNAEGQVKALKNAYQQANITPETIELMEAHGTGTKVGDAAEIKSMTAVYRTVQQNGPWCALGSVKSQIGHTKSAAGVAGLIKSALALHHKILPPTIKVERPALALSNGNTPFYVNTQKRPWLSSEKHPRRAAVSAFGFGGSNFHCVLEEYEPGKQEIDWSGKAQIFAFSAENPAQLTSALTTIDPSLAWDQLRSRAARLRQQFDATQPYRLLIVVDQTKSDLAKMLRNARVMLDKNQEKSSWNTPDGIYYGHGNVPGKLGVIFPGQGAQYVGMLRDLACQFPPFQEVLVVANQVFQQGQASSGSRRLSDVIYPFPAFDEETHQKNETALRATQVAQPAIGAVSLGLLKVLEYFGIQPELVAGHSYGELVSLCAAEVLDTKTFFALSKLRGQLMGQKTGDKGSMVAVQGDANTVAQIMQTEQLDLVIANKNSPQQTVLSGATREIERAVSVFTRQGLRCKQLQVAAAFHSRFVADASGTFLEALQHINLAAPKIPVFADSTGEPYPHDPDRIRQLLAGQLANPVEFIKIIENMYAAGVRTFLEVGPSSQMNGLIKTILEDKPVEILSVDVSAGKRSGETDLARTLSQLAAAGYDVRVSAWDDTPVALEETQPSKKRALAIPISGANYFKPKSPKPSVKSQSPSATAQGINRETPSAQSSQPLSREVKNQAEHTRNTQPPRRPQSEKPEIKKPSAVQPTKSEVTMSSPSKLLAREVSQSGQSSGSPEQIDRAEALRMAQENLRMLQQFQQQTADLHRQFLEGQDAARQTIERLLTQQQQLLLGTTTAAVASNPPLQRQPQAATSIGEQQEPAIQPIAQEIPAPTPAELPVAETATLATSDVRHASPLDEFPQNARHEVPPYACAQARTRALHRDSLPVDDLIRVEKVLLEIVAEKTGYPVEMLDLDMGLDADLGIDSIKRVEILSALQEQLPHTPEFKSDQIGTIQTLRQIAEFLQTNNGSATARQPTFQARQPSEGINCDQITRVLLHVVAEKTGYPADMLDLDMGLDADLGIDSIKRVEILSALQEQLTDLPEIGPDQIGRLQTLRQIVDFLSIHAISPGHHQVSISAASPSGGTDSAQIESLLLEVVAEKTGYPVEMLDLDMGLDADLGIDSIKRVEILSALQEQLPHTPEIRSEQIGTIQNLRQIVEFLSVGESVAIHSTISNQARAEATGLDSDQVATALLQVVAEKTGYPEDMLDLNMGLDADLGIDSIKRVEILSALQNELPGLPEIGSDQIGQIQTLQQIVEFLTTISTPIEEITVTETATTHVEPVAIEKEDSLGTLERSLVVPVKLADAKGRQTITLRRGATIWVTDDGTDLTPAIEQELQKQGFQAQRIMFNQFSTLRSSEQINGLIILAPPYEHIQPTFLKAAFKMLQTAGNGLREKTAVFVTVSRLDGAFGFRSLDPNLNPLSGGLAGLAKTVAYEWPEVHSKAFDVDASYNDVETIAQAIVDEMFRVGPAEVGISAEGRTTLDLRPVPLDGIEIIHPLTSADVVVMTGGARGVTAECALALARTYQPAIVLVGRSSMPTDEPQWLAGLEDEVEIKNSIIRNADRKMTPKEVGEEYHRILANREIQRNIRRIETAGSRVSYRSVDVRDTVAVQTLVADVEQQFGAITGLIHGAGVLADRKIEDKTEEQFNQVYDTKVAGLLNFLNVLSANPLKAIVLFSSTTARLGRVGQVDYAIANEVLNKLAQQQARLRPECRVVAINWGPWAGGMVTPALEKVFENEGIGLIPLRLGAEYMVQELSLKPHQHAPVEVVVLNSFSNKVDKMDRIDETDSILDSALHLAFERTLDIEHHPFLTSHVINGRAVLPAAITIEWLAHAALHDNPGLVLFGFDELRILKGVLLQANETYLLQVFVGKAAKAEQGYRVSTEMRGMDAQGKQMLHARADFLLTTKLPQAQRSINLSTMRPYPHQNGDIYQKYLFHGSHFQGLAQVEGYSAEGIIARSKAAPRPAEWITHPLRSHWLTDPLILDSSFQVMILWSIAHHQAPSLPTFIKHYRQFQPRFDANGGRIIAQVTTSNQHRALANIEFLDQNGTLLARMEEYECTLDSSLQQAFRRNVLEVRI